MKATAGPMRETTEDRQTGIADLVARAARLLPEQSPLQAFVHHNTLHAFEHLPFDDAVVHAARLFGTEPFQSEAAFQSRVDSGRIQQEDLDAVIEPMTADDDVPLVPGGPTRRRFHAIRLRFLLEVPRGPALSHLLQETDQRVRFTDRLSTRRHTELLRQARRDWTGPTAPEPTARALQEQLLCRLWSHLERMAPRVQVVERSTPRRRDQILAVTGLDPDELVHPLLIRLSAAFLDQGVAYWPMPGRHRGFLGAFRRLYGRPGGPPDRFLRGLGPELRRQEAESWTAERTVVWALTELDLPERDWADTIQATLLSLRGWAGMMRQFEHRPDRSPVEAHPARLIDYLAVQLILDVYAARHAVAEHLGGHATFADLDRLSVRREETAAPPEAGLELVYEAFVLAQVMPVDTAVLADAHHATAWLGAVRSCDAIERRRLLHLAYERRHRVGVLDALAAHQRVATGPSPRSRFQAVFCIDEREESLRRHLEEHFPQVETFGYAGFFGVAMTYRGLDEVRARPLCPVGVTSRHLVVEEAVGAANPVRSRRSTVARRRGAWSRLIAVGGRTVARGSAVTFGVGFASFFSLIGRCLFPLRFHRCLRRLHHGAGAGPVTRLAVERTSAEEHGDGLLRGYSVPEMVDLVSAVMRTMGLNPRSLVLIVGHGSSSLNNPHESAHDCGATGGGRGGPNARAFAVMANHAAVRAGLRDRGIDVPESSWFLGAYHNTCDDSMTYYDEDLIPERCRPAADRAKRAVAAACVLAAHERSRRFESAPADLPPGGALAHVETRTVDLGQPRPEYGHATNAACVVGRRSRTRGLFLDRRAFLVSYDPDGDPAGDLLTNLLLAAGPVCAGINLEYYFSYVDPAGYGCGTKLPHNIVGLLGVMDGHASDLRTGLPWQMVEIHEPVRLLLIVEAEPERLAAILRAHPALSRLVVNGWIQLVAWSPGSGAMHVFRDNAFQPHTPEITEFPVVGRSAQFYAGKRGHLGCAHVMTASEAAPFGATPSGVVASSEAVPSEGVSSGVVASSEAVPSEGVSSGVVASSEAVPSEGVSSGVVASSEAVPSEGVSSGVVASSEAVPSEGVSSGVVASSEAVPSEGVSSGVVASSEAVPSEGVSSGVVASSEAVSSEGVSSGVVASSEAAPSEAVSSGTASFPETASSGASGAGNGRASAGELASRAVRIQELP
ncbi:YbcC family protein [Streptosporangium sp. 'caverna']|uniref:YbcC family protein n=1 Tax=Streptosporangium sp. 'caverna' TaxID=2202249 RepID=UPI001EF8DC79|nr:putative inorganic carbon transporter subunit DabA [Streptosporangium sp. 'caverna']